MKQILQNLALIDLINFCKQNNIDCSGTHLYKRPKTWQYYLVRDTDGQSIVVTTFHKSSVPTHTIVKN